MTAREALVRLAGMRQGDRVLIHAAAGGVGLAAVQLAQREPGRGLCHGRQRQKREFLRSLGVQHVMSSRTLAFASGNHRCDRRRAWTSC